MKISILLICILLFLTGCVDQENSSNYSSERTSYEINTNSFNSMSSNNAVTSDTGKGAELSIFKTTIYTKTDARQNNVKLSCSQLNNCVVNPGETFSFCDTLRTC